MGALYPLLGDVGTYTLVTLPDPNDFIRRTAWVTDLWGALGVGMGGRLVSEGGFWKPIRPLVTGGMAVPATDTILQPLYHPTTLLVTGTVTVQRAFTLGVGSGFAVPSPGYRQRVSRKATGLLSVVVNGLALGLNSWVDYEFDGTAWQQTASGGLL